MKKIQKKRFMSNIKNYNKSMYCLQQNSLLLLKFAAD